MYLQIKTFSSVYKCLKCSSMFVCFKDLQLDGITKSIIRLSGIKCTGSISFCDSIHDKHFLKHCAASLVDTSFSSSPSSSSSLHTLQLSVESPTAMAKISSSDIYGEVGSSFSILRQSSTSRALGISSLSGCCICYNISTMDSAILSSLNSGCEFDSLLSRRTFEFLKAHRIIRCFNSLLKGLLGFLRLWVFKITTN